MTEVAVQDSDKKMGFEEIVYIGWIGHANLGDEALYFVSQETFKPYRLIKSHFSQHSGISLFGGGTVLPEWAAFILPNTYNYAYGVSASNFPSIKHVPTFVLDRMRRFPFRLLGVRDYASKRILQEWGIKSEVIGDPCLSLNAPHSARKEEGKIGINVVDPGKFAETAEPELAQICEELRRQSFRPILIPFCKEDISMISWISKKYDIEVFKEWRDIAKVLLFMSSCQVIIGQRLHSLILGAATYTPFISLEYSLKCRAFSETLGFSNLNVEPGLQSAENVMKKLFDLLRNWDEIHNALLERVPRFRKRLQEFGALIKEDIETLPEQKWDSRPASFPTALAYKTPYPKAMFYDFWRWFLNRIDDENADDPNGLHDMRTESGRGKIQTQI
jgi:hypothetical protein